MAKAQHNSHQPEPWLEKPRIAAVARVYRARNAAPPASAQSEIAPDRQEAMIIAILQTASAA